MAKRFSERALRELALVSDRAPTGLAASRFDPARVTVEAFRSWVLTKPSEEEYDFFDCGGCAFAQFLKSCGAPLEGAGGRGDWTALDGTQHPEILPSGILIGHPWTFGALADRLSQVSGQ